MIDTVLFDFDGTIMDTNEVIIQSWQETFWQLEGREEDREVLLQTFGEPLEGTMRDFFPDKPLEEALEIYRSHQRTNYLPNIHLFPGIRELLDELLQRGIKMALVTSRKRHSTDQTLKVFDLGKYFDCVVTADDVTWRKPNPKAEWLKRGVMAIVILLYCGTMVFAGTYEKFQEDQYVWLVDNEGTYHRVDKTDYEKVRFQ